MNRGLFILLIATLILVPFGTAWADEATIEYSVNSNNEIKLDANGNGTLEITLLGSENNYYAGLHVILSPDSNIELHNVSFEPDFSASITQPTIMPEQSSWYFEASNLNSNVIRGNTKCSINISYSGDKNQEPVITIEQVKLVYRQNPNVVPLTNNTPKTVKVIPSGGSSTPIDAEKYTIEKTNPSHGAITVTPSDPQEAGTAISLNISVDSGYKLSEWQVTTASGQVVELNSAAGQASNGFTMPAEDVIVTAIVDADDGKSLLRITVPSSDTGTIYLTVGDNSEITIDNDSRSQRITPGENISIRFKANNKTFSQWSTSGISPALSLSERQKNPLTFDMPDSTVTVSVATTTPQGGVGGSTTTTTTGSTTTTVDGTQTPLADGQRFSDVPPSHWAYTFVNYLAEKGYVNGKSALIFAPGDSITRAEFITILARMSGETLPAYAGTFTDVTADAYYAQAVAWGVANSITTGTTTTTFSPNSLITRQQIAAMLLRYADYKSFTFSTPNAAISFTDQAQISDYAKTAVGTMQQAGIINGYENGSFGPNRNANRAESSKMLALVHFLMENTDKTISDF